MDDENELNTSAGAFSSRLSSRSFDMPGGALLSSGVVVGCCRSVVRCFLVRLLPRPVLLASVVSRAGFSRSLWRVCSLSVPPYCRIVRLPVRSTSVAGRRRVASLSWFASIAVACCLPWLGRGCGGSVFLSWVLLVVAVSMASAVCVISVVPVVCFALVIIVGRHGLIVVGRWRRGSASSSVVVARRPALLVLGCRRWPCSPRWVPSAVNRLVDRFVDRFAARPLVPFCLLCGGATGVAGSLSSRAARCLGCRSLGSVRLPWWRLVLSVCLLTASVSCGGGALAWRVVAALPPSPVARAACLCGVRLSVGSASLAVSLAVRLIVRLVAPHVLAWRCAAVVGVSSRASRFLQIRISPRPSCREGGAIFLSLSALSICC